MEKLIQKIQSYNRISPEDLDFALRFYQQVDLKKGDFIVEEGQYVKHFYYLEKGCVSYYTLRNGKEQVMEFYTEDMFFTDLYSYIEEKPSNTFLRATEDCHLYMVSKENVEKIFSHSHQLERFGRLSMQEAFLKTFHKMTCQTQLSYEEMYLRLLAKRPDLFQRVPQYLIASYLGLTPVGLSKIRKRLSQTEKHS